MTGAAPVLGLAAGAVVGIVVRRLQVDRSSQPREDHVEAGGRRPSLSPPPPPVRAVAVALVAVVALVVGSVAAVVVAGSLAGGWVLARRRGERRRRVERNVALPDLVDLFSLAASAGLPVATALSVVAERSPPVLRPAMIAAASRTARGGSIAEALDGLRGPLGPRAVPLIDALDAAARTGSPLRPTLAAVGAAAHHQRARAAEEAARRLPVTLLFPLACCTLPAAVLLALVPVLVVSLGSLSG